MTRAAANPTSISPPSLRRRDIREAHFLRMPRFAARLYDLVLMKATESQTCDVARDLSTRMEQGRLLDIGTGPGRLLLKVHHQNPHIELFGLDISPAMIELARRNLSGVPATLRQGRAEQTAFPADFFDLVTCTGSFIFGTIPRKA